MVWQMRYHIALLLCLLLLAHTNTAAADIHEISAVHCNAPVRPANDQDDLLWQQYLAQVDSFRSCVNNQVTRHQQAVEVHQQQAKKWVNTWNEFVRTELNAPQDFPWPPEDGTGKAD